MEFRILGPLQLVVGGVERSVAGEKQEALLARLLLEPNRPVSTERLIDDLWGEQPPATARQSLHAHVLRLRRALAADGEDGSLLGNDGRGYILRLDEEQLDSARFRALVAAAREERQAGHSEAARAHYADALALWRGPVLDGVALERADAERAELDELRLTALEERIDADLELGQAAELVPELQRCVQAEPLRERLWAQLMLALYASGRQADALAAYQSARRELDALGLAPGTALRELEQRILAQDPDLVTMPTPTRGKSRKPARRATLAALAVAAVAVAAISAWLSRGDGLNAARTAVPLRAKVNSLVAIDPATNRIDSVTPVGRAPDSIASTSDAVWVANFADRTVSRLSLATNEVSVVGGAPVAAHLVSTLAGDVWLSSFEEPLITLIAPQGRVPTPDSRGLAAGPSQVRLPGSAEGLATGGGYLWITSPGDSGGRDSVFQVDLRTRRLVSSIPVGHLPLFVAFGYGSAWVSNYRGNSVSVIRPGGRAPETIAVEGGPLGIAAGARAIWVVTYWNRRLVRIDPETRRVLAGIPVGNGPLGVAVGAGAVWVTNRDSRTISRIDPATNTVTRTIHLDVVPQGIHFAHGQVWVTTQRCGSRGC